MPTVFACAAGLGALVLVGAACGRAGAVASEPPAASAAASSTSASARSAPGCAHSACGEQFFVDFVSPTDCAGGATCTASVRLAALGDFHINEDYPYRFTAEGTPGVSFLGTGPSNNVFSKPSGDWAAADPKSGALAVRFRPEGAGSPTISGTFKLSVCSKEKCLLEQRAISAPIAVR
jgi:hypothetical protein